MTPTCILINGPKRVGKDTAALAIKGLRKNIAIEPVMRMAKHHAIIEAGLDPGQWFDLFEMLKDTPFAELGGKTPRDIYIDFGNRKRAINPDAIIDMWLSELSMKVLIGIQAIVVPDVRFAAEFRAVLPIFQPKNVLLLRLYKNTDTRWMDGMPWEGDIGSYFESGAFWGHYENTLINDHDVAALQQEAAVIGGGFIARRR